MSHRLQRGKRLKGLDEFPAPARARRKQSSWRRPATTAETFAACLTAAALLGYLVGHAV